MKNTDRSFEERFFTWLQILGILFAAVIGFYQFIYKDFLSPGIISVNLEKAQDVDGVNNVGGVNSFPTPIKINVTITNPSTRTIYLLRSVWMAVGFDVIPKTLGESDFIHETNEVLASDNNFNQYSMKTCSLDPKPCIGVGKFLQNVELRPGESSNQTIVFFAPGNIYKLIEVLVMVPYELDGKNYDAEWKYNETKMTKEPSLSMELNQILQNGKKQSVDPNLAPLLIQNLYFSH